MLESRFDVLVESINKLNEEKIFSWQDAAPEILVFEHVAENAEMYKALLGTHAVGYVVNRVISYMANFVEYELRQEFTDEDTLAPIHLIAQNIAGSLFAQISWWLQNDMPYPRARDGPINPQHMPIGDFKVAR